MRDWKIGEIIGLISATCFGLTVVYVYAYSIPLHFDLLQYLTLNDCLRLAVTWLVPVALALGVGLLLEGSFSRAERGMTEEEIIAASTHPRFMRAFRGGSQRVMPAVLALAVVLDSVLLLLKQFPKPLYYQLWVIAGPYLWFTAIKWYAKERKFVAHWSKARLAWTWFFPALIIFSFFLGLSNGEAAESLASSKNIARVFVLGKTDPLAGRILFVLDDYVLLLPENGREVHAIPKTQISLIVEGGRK